MVFTLKTGVYLHTAYAQASDGSVGFSTTSATDAAYLGQYTDASATDATDPSRSTWTCICTPAAQKWENRSCPPMTRTNGG